MYWDGLYNENDLCLYSTLSKVHNLMYRWQSTNFENGIYNYELVDGGGVS